MLILIFVVSLQRENETLLINVAKIINNMKLTSTARSIIVSRIADFSIEVNKQPVTISHWLYMRPYMFLKIENYTPLKKFAKTDNIDDLFEFESEEEKQELLNKYRTLKYEQATIHTTIKE